MKNYFKKFTAILLILSMISLNVPMSVFAIESDLVKPSISITAPSNSSRHVGESVSYNVHFSDNVEVTSVPMDSSFVVLNGFTGNVSVTGTGYSSRTVTITNIQGTVGSNKTIGIKAGAAKDASGNSTLQIPNTISFSIVEEIQIDDVRPSISVSAPSNYTRYVGESVSYNVHFNDNDGVTSIPMNSSYVVLSGFTGNVSVTGTGYSSRTITITNIQGTVGSNKTIGIKAGAAKDASGNETLVIPKTIAFSIIDKEYVDDVRPSISISAPSSYTRYVGQSVSYTVNFADNVAVTSIPMNSSYVVLSGFTGKVSVTGTGYKQRTITITNIQGSVGPNKTIGIKAGAAKDASGNSTLQIPKTIAFRIIAKPIIIKPKKVIKTLPKVNSCIEAYEPQNCSDFISQMGDINNEITFFSSWLRAEKYTSQYVQENNYVAKDETMTYMVEYYNGSTAPMPNVAFELDIPQAATIEEINGNGRITYTSNLDTKIKWTVGRLEKGARCRLYVRVKFTGNESLETSKDISREFYVQLKTTAGGNTSYSYLRQLYIDKNQTKLGKFNKYLSVVKGNQIRPDDEITRAEFAKMLVESGIVKSKSGSEEYKTFTDYKEIPENAIDAVSALVGIDIIQGYADGEFKPNNPILRDDLMQMVAQALRYMSDTKLTINKPTYIYSDLMKDSNGNISEDKDYIMELMRQNIISKANTRPDEYAKRKEAVEIINNLTFRGPFVEKLPSNTTKYSDIRSDSNFFYNLVSATNTYKYRYDYRLWQETVEIVK